jgi:hypothetical protein
MRPCLCNYLSSVGTYSVLQVVFLLQRHTGYFLIQVGYKVLYFLYTGTSHGKFLSTGTSHKLPHP